MTRAKDKTDTEAPPLDPGAPDAPTVGGDVVPFGAAPLAHASDYGYEYRVADLIPTPAAWAEYEQRDLDDCLNQDFLIQDVMFLDSSIQEGAEWWIMLCSDLATGEQFTTAGGGSIITRKLHRLLAFPKGNGETAGMLPIVGKIERHESKTRGHNDYYDLI